MSAYNTRDLGCKPGFDPGDEKIPQRRKWQPTPVYLPGKYHGCRSLVGYSPRGRKELDTTERLNFHFQLSDHFRLPKWCSGQESACNAGHAGDVGLIPGSGRSSREGNGNPLQSSCLENSKDRGAWWATVQGVPRVGHD